MKLTVQSRGLERVRRLADHVAAAVARRLVVRERQRTSTPPATVPATLVGAAASETSTPSRD